MKFWESAEVEKSVYPSLKTTIALAQNDISGVMERALSSKSDWKFCYIPIIMGPEFLELYPPRTNIDRKHKKLYHSPQLSFEIFHSGTNDQRVSEYLRGIVVACGYLRTIGLSEDQVFEFRTGIEQLSPDR